MLSKEDSRRLAQLERQLRREDPEFCARMGGGNYSVPTRRRPPASLIVITVVVAVAALVSGLLGWWIAATVLAVWATGASVALAVRVCRLRTEFSPRRPF